MVFNLKAQTTIEFILVLMIVLIYINVFILPAQDFSLTTSHDEKRIISAETMMQKIHSSVIEVKLLGNGSKKKLKFFLDKGITFNCSTTDLSFTAKINNESTILVCTNEANEWVCSDSLSWPSGVSVNCNGSLPINTDFQRIVNVVVSFDGTTSTVNIEFS